MSTINPNLNLNQAAHQAHVAAAMRDAATVDHHEAARAVDDNAGFLDEMHDDQEEKNVRSRTMKQGLQKGVQVSGGQGPAGLLDDGIDPQTLARIQAEHEARQVDHQELQSGMDASGAADEMLDDDQDRREIARRRGAAQAGPARHETVYGSTEKDAMRLEELEGPRHAESLLEDLPEGTRKAAGNYLAAQVGADGTPKEHLQKLHSVEGSAELEMSPEPMGSEPLEIHDEITRRPLPPQELGPEIEAMATAAGA